MSKKLRLKDLAHDDVRDSVVSATERAAGLWRRHQKPLTIAAVAICVLGLGWTVSQYLSERQVTAQQSALGAALEKERLALQPPSAGPAAPTVTLEDARAALAGVVEEHGGSKVESIARLHLGTVELRLGRAADAVKTLDPLVKSASEDWITPHALMALATAQEEAGDEAAARASLDQLVAGSWRSLPKSAALLRTAELAERQGRTEDAVSSYRAVAGDSSFDGSSESGLAKQALERLGVASGT